MKPRNIPNPNLLRPVATSTAAKSPLTLNGPLVLMKRAQLQGFRLTQSDILGLLVAVGLRVSSCTATAYSVADDPSKSALLIHPIGLLPNGHALVITPLIEAKHQHKTEHVR